ncbi:MAG: hypothetical protein LBI01_03705 [Elusimicrobium sp.]|jgi:hypothetical protein|nr:hypothetical protein [Elusimicrobium sp.]
MKKLSILICAVLFAGAAYASFEPNMDDIRKGVEARQEDKPSVIRKIVEFFVGGEESGNGNIIDVEARKVDIASLREKFSGMTREVSQMRADCKTSDAELTKACDDQAKLLKNIIDEMDTNALNKKFDKERFNDYRKYWDTYQDIVSSIFKEQYNKAKKLNSKYTDNKFFEDHLKNLTFIIKNHFDTLAEIAKDVGMDTNAGQTAKK